MQRFAALLALATFAISLASCGGGSSNSSSSTKAASVTLSPASMTMNFGDVLTIAPSFKNSSDGTVYPNDVSYVSSNTSLVTVDSRGQVCAGTWDSNSVVCKPNGTQGTATIKVTGGGVSTTETVYVHPKVDRIVVDGSFDVANCASIAAAAPANKRTFSATAWSNGTKVDSSAIGPFSWTVSNGTVASVDSSGLCSTDNTCLITASAPGQTSVYASLATRDANGNLLGVPTSSTPGTFTSCPVKSISIHMPNAADTSATLNSAATQAMTVDVYDSSNTKLVDSAGALLSAAVMTYYSSQPLSASVSAGTITAASAGTSTTIGAACLPAAGCNVGLAPVYSNPFTVKVNAGSTATTTTVYVASTTGTSLVPVDTSTNTAGTAITLPNTPNSIAVTRGGGSVYLGSSNGLMILATGSTSVSTASGIVGKVISVSPDGTNVLVYNPPSSAPGTGTLYRYTISGTSPTASSTTITNAGTSAVASWSPDGSIAYIATGTKLTVLQTNGAVPRTYDAGQVSDLDFLTQGSFAYLAGTDVSVRATCNNEEKPAISIGGAPALVRSLPNAAAVLALYPNDLSAAAPRYLNPISVSTDGAGCPPAVTNTPGTPALLGTFIPRQMVLTPDSSKAFVIASDSATVYSYDVGSGAVTPIALQGSGVTGAYGGGVTLDGTKLYIGAAGSNNLHVINTSTNTDTQQISISFQPDLVAVVPK